MLHAIKVFSLLLYWQNKIGKKAAHVGRIDFTKVLRAVFSQEYTKSTKRH